MSVATTVLSSIFDKMEIRTAATEPMVINLKGPPDPQNRAILMKLKPAVIFTGPGGAYYDVAPYGIPEGIDPELKSAAWTGGIGVGLGVLGLILLTRYL